MGSWWRPARTGNFVNAKVIDNTKVSTKSTSSSDFAVEAAKRVAEKRKKENSKGSPSGDFAVEAAKAKAQELKNVRKDCEI